MPLISPPHKAPAFTLNDQHSRPHSRSDYAGKPVVLFFYPKDDTSGCTVEACAFRDTKPNFSKVKAVILGISPDDEKSHKKFADKFDLNFTLLADPGAKVCDLYGVWHQKSMFGNKYMGVVRTTYLIDPEGKVVRRWDKVNVEGHAEEVLEAVKSIALPAAR